MKSTKRIYIDLDCIMDTRLGTAVGLDNRAVDKLMKNDFWNKRISDQMFHKTDVTFTNEQFVEAYENRDKNTLFRSMRSNFMEYVQLQLLSFIKTGKFQQDILYTYTIEINIYPYVLSTEEINVIRNAITYLSLDGVSIEIIDKPLYSITISELNSRYAAIYTYDSYVDLMNTIRLDKPPPGVVLQPYLFGAELYRVNPDKIVIPSRSKGKVDINDTNENLTLFASHLSSVLYLNFIEVSAYNLYDIEKIVL